MIKTLKKLGLESRGAAAIEFALLAPVFLAFLLGMFEGARIIWVTQTMQDVAFRSVRCMIVGDAVAALSCKNDDQVQTFAVNQAKALGVPGVLKAGVTINRTSCNGKVGLGGVTIVAPFNPIAPGILPMFPTKVTARACFPVTPPSS